ncbi:MAG: sigma-70 family RNA polymerase sigma factor [Vulcanococcus sp.]|jgi:RNA polymerase primary sigma factor
MGLPATSVDWIIKQSHRYPLLTPAEEITLARQVQNWLAIADLPKPTKRQKAIIAKGRRARERFFLSNIRLAVNVAGKYQNFSGTLSLEDLIQEGLIGLDSAIAKFDPALGYKFSTYCYWWIRQGITRAINRYSRIIHLPMQANDAIRKAMDYMSEQLRLTGKLPPLGDVAEVAQVQRHTLIGYLNHHAHVLSLDQRMSNNESHNDFIDVVADPSSLNPQAANLEDFSDVLQEAIDELSEPHQHIIRERYFQEQRPATFVKISRDLKVSRQATQQMHDRAMNCLRLRLGGLQGQECIQALRSAA